MMPRFAFFLFLILITVTHSVLAMDPPAPNAFQNDIEGHIADVPGTVTEGKLPPLRLMPDKIETVDLEQDAAQVIVGNPEHVLGIVENTRSIVLVPRKPGATYIQIKDSFGKTIYERPVIIAAPTAKYVRVRKSCAAGNDKCQPFSVYYCPDVCHTIDIPALTTKTADPAAQQQTGTTLGPSPAEGSGPTSGTTPPAM